VDVSMEEQTLRISIGKACISVPYTRGTFSATESQELKMNSVWRNKLYEFPLEKHVQAC
jgi:hypothetical protein